MDAPLAQTEETPTKSEDSKRRSGRPKKKNAQPGAESRAAHSQSAHSVCSSALPVQKDHKDSDDESDDEALCENAFRRIHEKQLTELEGFCLQHVQPCMVLLLLKKHLQFLYSITEAYISTSVSVVRYFIFIS